MKVALALEGLKKYDFSSDLSKLQFLCMCESRAFSFGSTRAFPYSADELHQILAPLRAGCSLALLDTLPQVIGNPLSDLLSLPRSKLLLETKNEFNQNKFLAQVVRKKVAHHQVQNAPLEWFLSTFGLWVVSMLLNETCWLRIQWLTFTIKLLRFYCFSM